MRQPQLLKDVVGPGFLRHVEWWAETTSTQDLARDFSTVAPDEALPALFAAERQTAGRGQGNHAWHTASGSLAFTLVMPTLAAAPPLPLAAAMALIDASRLALGKEYHHEDSLPALRFHWPNDVYAEGKKLAGILTERMANGRALLGIGWNTRCQFDQAPSEIRQKAISLWELQRQLPTNLQLLELFLSAFQDRLGAEINRPRVEEGCGKAYPSKEDEQTAVSPPRAKCAQLLADVNAHWNLARLPLLVEVGGRKMLGVGERIDEDGALVFRGLEGQLRVVSGTARPIEIDFAEER